MQSGTATTVGNPGMEQNAVTIQVHNPGASSNRNLRFAASTSKGLGVTQVVIGLICIVASIIALAAGCPGDESRKGGCGIWSGIYYVITGCVAISAGKTRSNCMIVTCMVLSIIASVVCIFTLSFGAASVGQARANEYYHFYWECSGSRKDVSIVMGITLVVMAIAEAIIAIVMSAFCCAAGCCCNNAVPGQVYTQAYSGVAYPTSYTVVYNGSVATTGPVSAYSHPVSGGASYPVSGAASYPVSGATVAYSSTTTGPTPPPYSDDMTKPPPYNPHMM